MVWDALLDESIEGKTKTTKRLHTIKTANTAIKKSWDLSFFHCEGIFQSFVGRGGWIFVGKDEQRNRKKFPRNPTLFHAIDVANKKTLMCFLPRFFMI